MIVGSDNAIKIMHSFPDLGNNLNLTETRNPLGYRRKKEAEQKGQTKESFKLWNCL
jgi:hypothetical protein